MQAFQAIRTALRGVAPGLHLPRAWPGPGPADVPLRAELFNAEQMERHGQTLAQAHSLQAGRGRDLLLQRLDANALVLQQACDLLMESVRAGRRITPAGEWLLDNFYLIEEHILTARKHFSKWYSRELPVLANGPSRGLARVYDMALEIISHGDGRVDPENLNHFVASYQNVAQLKLGELWAIPIMLRLALIENLRRIGARVAQSLQERNRASSWADQMLHVAEHDPKNLILVISDMARSGTTLGNSFVAELARRLQGHSTALALPLTWIEQSLSESGQTIEQLVHSETQSQAINQVCISNSIASLRLLSATDWRDFVEEQSLVEHTLREDPLGVYPRMDFATRDRYRHVVEKTARLAKRPEAEVARKVLQLAQHAQSVAQTQASTPEPQAPSTHVGYYLEGAGLPVLERALQVQLPQTLALQRWARTHPLPLYLGAMVLLSLGGSAVFLQLARAQGLAGWALWLAAGLALLACGQLALTLVNWLATLLTTPHVLPRMDFSKGMAADARTLVVVPTLLTSPASVQALVEALEVRFLANQDAQLYYGLLTDWADASSETRDDDAPLLALASEGIAALNRKYPGPGQDTFFLFHRPRLWNAQERVWMGYERKRGKLAALNALLRGKPGTAFSCVVGDTAALQQVRFVITLDTDTQLQRDTARSFAATMAHPLNRAQWDAQRQCITAGYGILQPRMAVSLQSSNRSRYARLMGSEAGVDPYTRAVSDVYQDLFHEGSFIGKGIYDVDVFEQVLHQRLPDNRILSHDLLEGCYARSGLLSDVQLYDDYPARYDADVSRRVRWMRGDWQIASWLLPRVPGFVPGVREANPLSWLSQWKVLDNLRRSLVAPATLALLLLGWALLPQALGWTLAVLALWLLTPVASNLWSLLHKPQDLPWRQHARTVQGALQKQLLQVALTLALLPHEAWFCLDAVLRTNARLLLTHRRLLEWQSSDAAALCPVPAGSAADLRRTLARMAMAPLLAVATAVLLWRLDARLHTLWQVAPILLAWLLAPGLAWWISRPVSAAPVQLDLSQTLFLRQLARRTWRFFERFVSAQDHWLPPDNYQEHPVAVLARRTSPTNMGLALLANATAYDFGYISSGQLLQRTADALHSMQTLERHAGHFYNWYDTQTCQPLLPRYISAVDSGNLSGHLLTLRPALLALADQPILNPRTFHGMADALGNLILALDGAASAELQRSLSQLAQKLELQCSAPPLSVRTALLCLDSVATLGASLLGLLQGTSGDAAAQAQPWCLALLAQCADASAELALLHVAAPDAGNAPAPSEPPSIPTLRALAAAGQPQALARLDQLETLARQAAAMALADYGFLFDSARHLLAVGYNVDERRLDTGHYDLLASEARLCSFVAIALGELPQDNWFALGRRLTSAGAEPTLLSWSGSMFEYLMPNLVMPVYANTLLDQTCRAVVQRQIAYGEQHGVPWGISESGYNTVDAALNYQYRAFGVPGLGLKRGLADDLVIAPYASALALMVLPDAACRNLQRMTDQGLQGDYGMYEAMDFTPSRLPHGQSGAVVRSFMAHHQGMSLLAISHVLLDQPMPRRFAAEAMFQATALLLQERVPNAAVFQAHAPELADIHSAVLGQASPLRVLRQPDAATPEVQLLSNGSYHVLVSQSGGGYSRWKGLDLTRWREDGTRDNWGSFCYVRDVASGDFWSGAHQPTLQASDSYEAIFSEGRAEFRRRDHGLETHTEIVVSPEDDIELRRTRITNRSRSRRSIEVTSYAEVVLAPAAADALHPAFSKLFVQTEIVRERQALLCHRRPRDAGEAPAFLFHLMAVHGADAHATSFETDRMRFIGRTRSLQAPQALDADCQALSDTAGPVLDPVLAIRHRIVLAPGQTVTLDLVTGVAEAREQALALMDKYRDRHLADRVLGLAITHAWVNLQQINASEADAQLYARLASSVVYANPAQRAQMAVLGSNRRGQSGLWGYGVSGDLPIVLLQISKQDNIELVRQLVQAHAYWRLKGLAVDLVIWNEDHAGYRQALQEQIMGLIASGLEANFTDRPGGIFVRMAEHMSAEDRTLFQAVARIVISDKQGSLMDQANRRQGREARTLPALLAPVVALPVLSLPPVPLPAGLQCFNGLGGFSADGREYVIATTVDEKGQHSSTPLPWVNVIANAHFGTVVSESGSAYTWSENAHEFRYTPWSNDPVSDGTGEACYLRDEESGAFWSPTALPCGGAGRHVTRHGFGYSVFAHTQDGIETELTVFVDLSAAIKFSQLRVRNRSQRARKLSATGYVEWVLGDLPSKSAMHVGTEMEPGSGALLARNPYNPEFGDRMAFFDADGDTRGPGVTFSCDRREFLGRNGSVARPLALLRTGLSNRVGTGLDPCAAIQVPFELQDGQERVITFRLGAAGRRGLEDARLNVQQLREPMGAQGALQAVQAYWTQTLGAVQVQTPDVALNLLANGWLLYQTLACRLWARTGLYQSGGAYGFRDQLQDSMALVHAAPQLLREHLLRCAARQFVEGDVQHWWHPPQGRGVRTLCSDDYLWLVQATCRYVQATGDSAVLLESVPFLKGRALNPEEESYYDLPSVSEEHENLYAHCVLALRHGLRMGAHGLPLMGSGDWNDGMNLVGIKGRGESVWLAFFLFDTLKKFSVLARATGDIAFADECLAHAEQLRLNIDAHAWDGDWYRRAWFDDGTPLGSVQNAECQIDSITQSWAQISGAGDPVRTATALNALERRLVKREEGLIQLLTPPFDTSALNPGYIKGYLPGVRENGGQYTHAAIWTVMAFAAQGDSQRAWDCFNLINPVRHGSDAASVAIYQVEPYVVAADVYAVAPHAGRGGWTWYTGSASWMYRLVLESLLGLRLEVDTLHFTPCLPADWPGFAMQYRFGATLYAIEVKRVSAVDSLAPVTVLLDGVLQPGAAVPLHDDLAAHTVVVRV
ncbi:cyclic beta 1-2 glucan synthetase [Rhodoferax lacus]|uniref:Cyclic beta 1-2 glucan synthetase n=1 Tax=Rhodoferax lacus TaxID=2184758 RepID=A0A3E1RCS2_9BURK|nr:glucoamylase family protein [Rhodoferax lacus]RFO97165.1 cyclic beta 1-2 glucan synthetase [Rhodoferax lacus]